MDYCNSDVDIAVFNSTWSNGFFKRAVLRLGEKCVRRRTGPLNQQFIYNKPSAVGGVAETLATFISKILFTIYFWRFSPCLIIESLINKNFVWKKAGKVSMCYSTWEWWMGRQRLSQPSSPKTNVISLQFRSGLESIFSTFYPWIRGKNKIRRFFVAKNRFFCEQPKTQHYLKASNFDEDFD